MYAIYDMMKKKTIGKSWKGEEGGLQIVLEIVQKDIKMF